MPPNPAPGINPVALTYSSSPQPAPSSSSGSGSGSGGSTAASIPHPEPISSKVYYIAGMVVTVYGLEELGPLSSADTTDVGVLWLLHPRLQTQECMAPFAAHIISSWNKHAQTSSSEQRRKRRRGLIAVSFDQRNHGSREVSPLANEAWRGGNETHAQDMFSSYQGTAADTSQLIDYLPGYIFPGHRQRRHQHQQLGLGIGPHIVMGVSLGGHAAWQCLIHDARVTAAIVTIGCPDYERLMTDRARLSKRKTWFDGGDGAGNGAHFLGSSDYPPSLIESVRRWDPASLIFGTLHDIKAGRGPSAKAQDSNHPHPHHRADPMADPPSPASLTPAEKAALKPVLQRCFGNKRILNLSGGADRLVPYERCSKPFLQWLKAAMGSSSSSSSSENSENSAGFFNDHRSGGGGGGSLYLKDIVLPGVGHDVPPKMVEYMIPFVIDTLELADTAAAAGGGSGHADADAQPGRRNSSSRPGSGKDSRI